PGSTSTRYSTNWPPSLSPRQTRRLRSAIGPLQLLQGRVGDLRQLRRVLGALALLDDHVAVRTLVDEHVVALPLVALALVVDAAVGAAALLADQRRPGHGLGGGEQAVEVEGLGPAGVVLAGAVRLHLLGLAPERADLLDALGEPLLVAPDADVAGAHVAQLLVHHVRVRAALAVERGGGA